MPATRNTKQQAAIERTLAASERPLSPAEVLELTRRKLPTLSLATVYRAIRRLEEAGRAIRVEIPGQPPRYESESAAERHHHHFVCRHCDRVFDIPGCARGVESLAPDGFTVEAHEIVLYGSCDTCADGV